METLRTIGRPLARAVIAAGNWTGGRIEDIAMWAAHLLRDLPVRVGRLSLTLWAGLWGLLTMIPSAIRAWQTGGSSGLKIWVRNGTLYAAAWLGTLLTRLLDLPGVPELMEFFWRMVTRVSPLTGTEIAAASLVLGPTALRYGDVRVARGGLLRLVHAWNRGRAFAMFNTVNLPLSGPRAREHLDVLIHELVHVYQYERLGSIYTGESIYAQQTAGYGYGGAEGLCRALAEGKQYCTYNREQQAQIVQDYYLQLCSGSDTTDYEPFIAQMRAGKFNA